jgi:hypothetical protein
MKSIKNARIDNMSSLADSSSSETEFNIMIHAIKNEETLLSQEQDIILKDNSLGKYEKKKIEKMFYA